MYKECCTDVPYTLEDYEEAYKALYEAGRVLKDFQRGKLVHDVQRRERVIAALTTIEEVIGCIRSEIMANGAYPYRLMKSGETDT